MAKEKISYVCRECGKSHHKWSGQCEGCKAWNTLTETVESLVSLPSGSRVAHRVKNITSTLTAPSKNSNTSSVRISSGISEFDRVLGGGFFPGSISLLIGDPGVGKSTLALLALVHIARSMPDKKVILVSGEESAGQISDRLFRMVPTPPANLFLLAEGIWENAVLQIPIPDTGFLLFDSVQTIATLEIPSASGSLAQSVAVVERMMMLSKTNNIPALLIGHVTKTGEMAGPQTMAHLVDTVLHLEAEGYSEYRMLRSKKNRFGAVSEIGIFEMNESGLQEVKNPSQHFLAGRLENAIGSAIFPSVEGSRSYLMEIQALSKYTSFGYPKRSTSGFDANRLAILLAVLGRFTSAKLESEDVFLNIAGGLKASEPAADVAVMAAILSSKKKTPLPSGYVFLGEVGLTGEIRHVPYLEKRLQEAKKLGFRTAVIPAFSMNAAMQKIFPCIGIKTVTELETIISA